MYNPFHFKLKKIYMLKIRKNKICYWKEIKKGIKSRSYHLPIFTTHPEYVESFEPDPWQFWAFCDNPASQVYHMYKILFPSNESIEVKVRLVVKLVVAILVCIIKKISFLAFSHPIESTIYPCNGKRRSLFSFDSC